MVERASLPHSPRFLIRRVLLALVFMQLRIFGGLPSIEIFKTPDRFYLLARSNCMCPRRLKPLREPLSKWRHLMRRWLHEMCATAAGEAISPELGGLP